MQNNEVAAIKDMLYYATLAQQFAANHPSIKSFFQSDETQLAVIRCLEVIGEATTRISEEVKAERRDIPWAKVKGMRNVLIHGYDQVEPSLVWQAVRESLPLLVKQLESLLKENGHDTQ